MYITLSRGCSFEDSILNSDTDLDGNPNNGIQFWVKGKVTDSTSLLKVTKEFAKYFLLSV